jgi:hypothetical protein
MFMALGLASVASAAHIWVDASYDVPDLWDGVPDETIILDPCDVVWLNVYGSELNTIPGQSTLGLASFGFNASFDPDQLDLTPGTGVAYGMDWQLGITNEHDNYVYMMGGNLTEGMKNDTSLLGIIELHCTSPGVSYLNFANPDPGVEGWVLGDGTLVGDLINYPSIEIINTPIPSAVLLLGSGLVGLGGFSRYRKKK